ncbi:hypothetical protein Hanom_Chr07g00590111 [Helianthus anomalus]
MATLEKDEGDNPPRTTTLKGKVGRRTMEMSFDTIRQVANFDTKEEGTYYYPPNREIYKQNHGEEIDQNMKDLLF